MPHARIDWQQPTSDDKGGGAGRDGGCHYSSCSHDSSEVENVRRNSFVHVSFSFVRAFVEKLNHTFMHNSAIQIYPSRCVV